eukprot:m.133867 g.133867  ORF g.133867 m.133867 type:complete len:77 (-) comp22502_c0_seq4:480-710(-)
MHWEMPSVWRLALHLELHWALLSGWHLALQWALRLVQHWDVSSVTLLGVKSVEMYIAHTSADTSTAHRRWYRNLMV